MESIVSEFGGVFIGILALLVIVFRAVNIDASELFTKSKSHFINRLKTWCVYFLVAALLATALTIALANIDHKPSCGANRYVGCDDYGSF